MGQTKIQKKNSDLNFVSFNAPLLCFSLKGKGEIIIEMSQLNDGREFGESQGNELFTSGGR